MLDEGTLSITDVAELQLTDLMQKLKPEEATSSSSSESEQEEEEDEQERGSGWKTLSKPIAPVKVSNHLQDPGSMLLLLHVTVTLASSI